MDLADEYLKQSTGIQIFVINSLLNEFEEEVSKMKGTIMDVGCGPGNNTKDLILPKISKDALLVGLDISKNMVDCARTLNTEEERLTFEQLNIETAKLPVKYIGRFNNGFSFFCLHWIEDLRRAFQNIYQMLTPGGNFISQHILSYSAYKPFLRLAKYPQYKEYMKDAEKFIAPLYFDENPRAALKKILQDVGFQVLHCSLREKILVHDSQQNRKELYTAVNPFVFRMPKDLQNKFMDDLMRETLKEESVMFRRNENPADEDKIVELLKFVILHIRKPKN